MYQNKYHVYGIHSTHYDDVIMSTIASQITSLTIIYSTIYSGADQSKHQRSASLAFVWGIHRGPVNSPHKWPVTRKMFPFNDVIMRQLKSKPYNQATVKALFQIKISTTYLKYSCTLQPLKSYSPEKQNMGIINSFAPGHVTNFDVYFSPRYTDLQYFF